METTNTRKTAGPSTASSTAQGAATAATAAASEHPLGPNAAAILGTEHWSLLASRSLIWNEAMSRTTVFLTVLSASIIALALLADATGFGPRTTTLALVLLPVVLNRLRHAYLTIAPGLEPYFTTGHHGAVGQENAHLHAVEPTTLALTVGCDLRRWRSAQRLPAFTEARASG
jgi:hypothetical protein